MMASIDGIWRWDWDEDEESAWKLESIHLNDDKMDWANAKEETYFELSQSVSYQVWVDLKALCHRFWYTRVWFVCWLEDLSIHWMWRSDSFLKMCIVSEGDGRAQGSELRLNLSSSDLGLNDGTIRQPTDQPATGSKHSSSHLSFQHQTWSSDIPRVSLSQSEWSAPTARCGRRCVYLLWTLQTSIQQAQIWNLR